MQSPESKNMTLKNLSRNSRFYILVFSFLLSIFLLTLTRLQVTSDQLFYIRLQQQYGLLSILFWYFALIISPLGYAIGKQRMKHFEFARRAIGVSAAYFAALHVGVALWGQLGGVSQLAYLPTTYVWSLLFGSIALLTLLVMAATSFDKVIRFMTFKRWKWLHRLVYGAGVLVIIHIWMIGTHVTYSGVQIAALIALIILAGLETFRIVTLMTKEHLELRAKKHFAAVFLIIWLFFISFILNLPNTIQNYNDRHTPKSQSSSHSGGHHE